jgi:tetratricopeptide (TPR) repeat protein
VADESPTSLLEQEMTDVGVLLGTRPYMAPELFEQSTGNAASDQFAFCVTLYELLHGERPFRSRTLFEHIEKVRLGKIPPFRPNREVPPWLHRVTVRGLSPQAGDRYSTIPALVEAMHLDRRRRRRRFFALTLAIPLLSTGAAVAAVALQPEPTQAEVDLTERIVTEARAAAAKGYFVHPPVDEPDYPTAFAKVLELEGFTGAVKGAAEGAATGLREEMASTLVRLGDTYYERPGGPPFAADFYAMALVFDPDNERALARATVTPGQLAALRTKAAEGGFSETELVAAEPLAVLADEDEVTRSKKVETMRRRGVQVSATSQARLEEVLGTAPVEVEAPKAARAEPKPVTEAPAAEGDVAAEPGQAEPEEPQEELEADALEEPAKVETRERPGGDTNGSPDANHRDPKQAEAEAKLGRRAFSSGNFAEAERHYHKALQHDRRNLSALEGLTDLHFERSQYEKAVGFAKRATGIAPKRSRLHIKLGDAYFKVFRYNEARHAYKRADELGSRTAKGRLARLTSKVSG